MSKLHAFNAQENGYRAHELKLADVVELAEEADTYHPFSADSAAVVNRYEPKRHHAGVEKLKAQARQRLDTPSLRSLSRAQILAENLRRKQ